MISVMESSIDSEEIKKYLDKICADDLFSKSVNLQHLLKFLVEQALNNEDLKEYTIGLNLYKKNYEGDKNDGIVRVHIYNLRKKLKVYYANSGKEDALIFSLDKGSYNMKFIFQKRQEKCDNRENKDTKDEEKNICVKHKGYIFKCCLGVFIGVLFIFSLCILFKSKVYCWENFFEKNVDNVCVVADQVILHKIGDKAGVLRTLRDVNSASDFISYNEKHINDSLIISDYTFLTKGIPFSLHSLSRWFYKNNNDYDIVCESEFKFVDSQRSNIIYIGQFKTMSVSKKLFLRDSKVFKAYYNYFSYDDGKKKVDYKSEYNDGIVSEYAMVSFMPLKNGHSALFFVSNNDFGTMMILQKFINLKYLKEFYSKLPTTDCFFNALYKVNNVDRTGTTCELVNMEVLPFNN